MRLIEVAACHRNIGPIGCGIVSRQVNGALKTLDAREQLRRDTDLLGEYLDKMPLAQPEMFGNISSPRLARPAMTRFQYVQSGSNSSMFCERILQTCEQ